MRHVLIISNLFGNNRQGYDLAHVLRESGCHVRLVQYAEESDPAIGNYGVGYVKPHGIFSKFHVLSNLLRIFFRSVTARRDVVVCIGRPLLVEAAILAMTSDADLVYYSLEYGKYTKPQEFVVRHCIQRYIDVEESRRERIYSDLSIVVPYRIMYNLPAYSSDVCECGSLRKYLVNHKGLTGSEKIVLYAGSYQSYACLEQIHAASECFPDGVVLVLMVARGLPASCCKETPKCKIVPALDGQKFFDWLSDADCSLLPYESDTDFNVLNCSPQKLFDCYRVGVPYVASDRPLIRKVHSEYLNAGVFCDFTSTESIVQSVGNAVSLKTLDSVRVMKKMYQDKYNYAQAAKWLVPFVLGDCC